MTDRIDINRLLVEMRQLKSQTQAFSRPDANGVRDVANGNMRSLGGLEAPGGVKNTTQSQSFTELFTKAIDQVNETQKASATLSRSYEQGEAGVDITDVMIAKEKASVSFQSMVQVRNKLVDAYRDIMNMPI